MRLDITQLLNKLDFNGVHCGDVIAAAYFRESAIALRLLEGERDHWQHAASIERQNAAALRAEVRELERRLAAATAQGIEAAAAGETREAGLDAEHESPVAEGEAPNGRPIA